MGHLTPQKCDVENKVEKRGKLMLNTDMHYY